MGKRQAMGGELDGADVEAVFRAIAEAMPGRVRGAKGPKGQPDAFRGCISCMLSAQSRDANTALASKALFRLARSPRGLLALDQATIAQAIRPCGLYNMKARNIHKFCRALLDEHGGVVPDTREGLMSLPGIGRKCADIVLQFHFEQDTIAVDTHVHRACNRTGLARGATADQTARALEARAPDWAMAEGHFWLIQFGKRVCTSRAPKCTECPVATLCVHRQSEQES